MPPGLKKPLELWHLILAVALPLIGYLVMAGAAFADSKTTDSDHEKRITKLETTSEKTGRNVIIIGEHMGLGPRLER